VESVTVIELRGALTSNDGDPGLRAAVRQAIDQGGHSIVVNLQAVTDIDSFGLAILASGHMSAVSRGGRLTISNLSRKLKHLFAITRLDSVFEIYETEEAAISSIRATD
jgi:anti-sigma B factor antagonist